MTDEQQESYAQLLQDRSTFFDNANLPPSVAGHFEPIWDRVIEEVSQEHDAEDVTDLIFLRNYIATLHAGHHELRDRLTKAETAVMAVTVTERKQILRLFFERFMVRVTDMDAYTVGGDGVIDGPQMEEFTKEFIGG